MRLSAKLTTIITVFFLLTILATAAFAVPQAINYQGYIEGPGGVPVNGTVSMTFKIYNAASGGSALWTETQSSVAVTGGAFSVVLGSLASLTTLPFDEQYYLGVTVGADAEMEPRAVLVSVPYAMRASDSDMVDGQHSDEIIDAASDEVRTPISSLPFYVNTPGSYYLTGDLSLTNTSWDGITVNVDNVTIDLMGFTISGPGSGSGVGIYMYGRHNVEIRNGTVRQFGYRGISDGSSASRGHRIIGVRVEDNQDIGIFLLGDDGGHLVKDVTAFGNANHGIFVYNGSTVSGCVSAKNGIYGISSTNGATITGNTVYGNVTLGVNGGTGATITGNTAYANGAGIYGIGSTIKGNTAYGNNSYGINADFGSTVKDNTAYYNWYEGIRLHGGSLVDGNTAYGNNQSGGPYLNMSGCATCVYGDNYAL